MDRAIQLLLTCLTLIRSRELIAFKENKAKLIAEWTPNDEVSSGAKTP